MGTIIKGVNDLETYCKQNNMEHLLREWHPVLNDNLTPSDVTVGSGQKVWWLLPYDDPDTGKHFEFEWEARIQDRTGGGRSCPYISGKAVYKGFNDLATTHPELAKEWHPTRNGSLTPADVIAGSHKKVWWLLPYDDPETGKHFDFEWEAQLKSRVQGIGCPYLSGHAVYKGFNDLETLYPEIAKEWHPTKNGSLTSFDVTTGTAKKVWWLLSYDDPNTGRHFDFEWEAEIKNRVAQSLGCPYLSGKAVYKGFNDLETLYPDIAKQWHPIKNGSLLPSDVTVGCNKKVWWLLPYDDPITGKHFDFEWKAVIANRIIQGNGCPYLSGRYAHKGFNDLATTHPEIAKEWHPTKNAILTPSDVTAGSRKKVWWLLPYDDPVTGKHFEFEWKATIDNRVKGKGCPYLSGRAVYKGFNDLATLHPELTKEWHPTRNGNLTLSDVTKGSGKKVWWLLPYDDPITGKHFDFEWVATINHRVRGNGCPYLSASKTEQLLYTYCRANQIVFIAEKKFVDLPYIKFYPFDLYLSWDNLILEADGIQHFENNAYFYSTEKEFQDRVRTDNLKNKYCLEKGIPILRIPYTYDSVVDKNKIEGFVKEFIKTRLVPQEILDFYKPFKKRIGSNYFDVASELNKRVL